MTLRSRVGALERARTGLGPLPGDCPVCRGRGAGGARIVHRPEPGEPAAPPAGPEGCPACGRRTPYCLTLLLPPRSEVAAILSRANAEGARGR